MFDWLKELVLFLREKFNPVVVINHYDRGVRLSWGRYTGTVLKPGRHWRFPWHTICTVRIKPTTLDLTEQSVTTKNGKELVVECSVKYSISSPATVLLETYSATDALADTAKGIIRRVITQHYWPEMNTEIAWEEEVLKQLKAEAAQWGIRVMRFNVATLAPMRSYRLINTYNQKASEHSV